MAAAVLKVFHKGTAEQNCSQIKDGVNPQYAYHSALLQNMNIAKYSKFTSLLIKFNVFRLEFRLP